MPSSPTFPRSMSHFLLAQFCVLICCFKSILSNLCCLYAPGCMATEWGVVHLPGLTPLKKSDPLSFSICLLPVTTQCRGETLCSSACSSLGFVLLTLSWLLYMLPQSLRILLCNCSTVSGEQIPYQLWQWFLSLGRRKYGIDVSFKGPALCSLLFSIFWPGVGLHVNCLLQKEVSMMRGKS